jgi:adenylate kinase
MNILILGAPGSGKGTQAEKIVERYSVAHLSTGDLLRAEVAADTPLGREAKKIMDAGQLVPDDIMLGMIRDRLAGLSGGGGFLLDGFPRTLVQAQGLDAMLAELGCPVDAVIALDVDYEEIMTRLLARRRADDNEATIRKRLAVYEKHTAPLISYFQDQSKLRRVEGVGTVDEIFDRIRAQLDAI